MVYMEERESPCKHIYIVHLKFPHVHKTVYIYIGNDLVPDVDLIYMGRTMFRS